MKNKPEKSEGRVKRYIGVDRLFYYDDSPTKKTTTMKDLKNHTPTDNQFNEHSGYVVYWNAGSYCKQFDSIWDAVKFGRKIGACHIVERVIKLKSGEEVDGNSIKI